MTGWCMSLVLRVESSWSIGWVWFMSRMSMVQSDQKCLVLRQRLIQMWIAHRELKSVYCSLSCFMAQAEQFQPRLHRTQQRLHQQSRLPHWSLLLPTQIRPKLIFQLWSTCQSHWCNWFIHQVRRNRSWRIWYSGSPPWNFQYSLFRGKDVTWPIFGGEVRGLSWASF